jgi:hypothetical protein
MKIPQEARSFFNEYSSHDMINLRQLASDFATESVAAGAAAEVEAKIIILKRIESQGYPEEVFIGGKMRGVNSAIREYKRISKMIDRILSNYGSGLHVNH